ncbi:unnamed protein product [Citrullus colocynthis]|uniref:Uncharacterized protein n=1 Tax=Citrullus colocynthis TaxID=252529 RepID=A0ABP0XYS0_9ROSI
MCMYAKKDLNLIKIIKINLSFFPISCSGKFRRIIRSPPPVSLDASSPLLLLTKQPPLRHLSLWTVFRPSPVIGNCSSFAISTWVV